MAIRAEGPPRAEPRRNVSFSGLIGGLLGAGMFAALAVAVAIDPGEGSRWWSPAFAVTALAFVPAVVVAVRPAAARDAVLRFTTIGCLILAVAGTLVFGPILAFLLAPATALLAVAAGLIWQGGARK